ncbi:hypothetical protein [Rhizobium rosettiformans]|uniref:hypothetical protein n=1 Tax=Rhizobium rosettiformans TaxID=1368430 RepID=UPI00285DFD1D|nr:hypothetical protein [Rhizobium rosettiformans]MDR7029827.1 hypothetical protein [Rhizobium rosettiformans]MDR7063541.1 hypothetical protein [Rhizobium rosettiformans]
MGKQIKLYITVVVAVGIASGIKSLFDIPDLWMAVSAIAVIGVIALMQVESRLDKIEEKVLHKDYSGVMAKLEGERHVPRHQQPKSLAEGGAIASWITPDHETLFHDFRWFGAVLNKHLTEPWAIEELPTTDAGGYDGPDVGRMYDVWYGSWKVGRMQVTLGTGLRMSKGKSPDKRSAFLELDVSYLRFIPYQHARGLLYELALMVGDYHRDKDETCRAKAQALAANALAGYLWEAVRSPDLNPALDFIVEGSYDLLRDQNDHWEKHGYDPIVHGGDRG